MERILVDGSRETSLSKARRESQFEAANRIEVRQRSKAK